MLACAKRLHQNPRKSQVQKRHFASLPEVPQNTRVSKLANGVRVVSLEFARPTAAIGVFVNAGTRHEDGHSLGSVAFLKQLAFQNSKNRTAVRLVREFELLGSTYTVSATREQIIYAAQCRFENVKDILPLLSDATHPQIAPYQIKDALHPVEEHSAEQKTDPRNYVLDSLHQRAYRQVGLGNSLYISPATAHHVSAESVQNYHNKVYVPENISVVAVGGVKHDELVSLAQKLFTQSGSAPAKKTSEYFGGETLETIATDKTYFSLAYKGLSASDALSPAALVLRAVLGEVSRHYREDAVGTGVSGILSRNILADHSAVESLEANSFSYSDSGLFSIYGVADHAKDHKYASHLATVLQSLPSQITEQHLQRGKSIAQAHVAFHQNSSLSETLEFIGTQVGANANASNYAPAATHQAIEAVTLGQLQQVSKQIFASKPTVVAVGAVGGFPSLV